MTKKTKEKTIARALQQSEGGSYQQQLQRVRDGAANPKATPTTPLLLEELLATLRVDRTFAIQIGKQPTIGQSADPRIALKQVRELQRNPQWYAVAGGVERLLSRQEYETLLRAGAAADDEIQVIRTFRNEHGVTFSDQCSKCDRWIWCGKDEREDVCVCGFKYRVTFDLAGAHHWQQRQNACCMDCGAAHELTEPHEGRNPWHLVNAWQSQCNACFAKASSTKSDSRWRINRVDLDGQRGPAEAIGPCPTCERRQVVPIPGGAVGTLLDVTCADCDAKFGIAVPA